MPSNDAPGNPLFSNTNFNAAPPGAGAPPPSPAPRRPWWKKLLRITGWILFSLVLLVGILVALAAFFDKQITRQVISELNKSLKSEIKVGDAGLSLISGFPKAAVDLKAVQVKDAFGGSLLKAEEVSLRFDLLSLFGSQIKVNTVKISNGAMRMVINRQGKSNTDITKDTKPSNKPSSDQGGTNIRLENAELSNMGVLYDNQLARQTAELLVDHAHLSGNFSADQFDLASQADFKVIRLDSDSSRYLAGEQVHYDAVVGVDLKKGIYDLQRVELGIGGNTFSVDGIAVSKPEYTDLNLKLTSQEGDISMIANLLPGEYHAYFREFESSGSYTCAGSVKGRLSKTDNPTIDFSVSLNQGKVTSDMLQSPIRDVSFKAKYTALPDGSGAFEIANFKGNFGGQPLGFNLKINNLNDPVVDFQCNGVLPLDATYGLFNSDNISAGDGLVRLEGLSVQGRYADMTSMSRIGQVLATGSIAFDKAEIEYNKIPVKIPSGAIRLQGNQLAIDQLIVYAGRSDFALSGQASNLLPVLFADSLNTTDALLEFSADMDTKNLDVDQLISLFSVQTTGAPEATVDSLKEEKNTAHQRTTEKLKGTFNATINYFTYGKITGDHFNGALAFDHNELIIKGSTNSMQGRLQLDGVAHFEVKPRIDMRITAQNLDLQTMLAQCENFGQDVVTDKNLKGKLSGRLALWAYWNETGDFDYDQLKVYAELDGKNGELVDLKMLEDFSTFIHIEDLRKIKFTDMHNAFEISRQKLYIPVMFIQSNALNLSLSGTHSFDDDIDYKFKVNAGQLLVNRIKKHDKDLEPLPAEKGLFNVFYTMKGTLDKYDLVRGKKAVVAEFEKSEARKQVITDALNQAFAPAAVVAAPQEQTQ